MSKSKGNVIAPQKVSDTLGADILRLWTAATDYSGELSISDEILKRVVEGYRRIRNTLRFLLANTSDFDARQGPAAGRAVAGNRPLRAGHDAPVAGAVRAPITASTNSTASSRRCRSFCSEDLGGFYLDILKDRLYTAAAELQRPPLGAERAVAHHAELSRN